MSGRYPLENSFYYHIVSGGDTLEKIAELYKTTPDEIRALNTFESDELVLSDYIKVPCTLGQLEPDGYMDEGSKFAEYMANLDPELKKQKYSLELLAHVKDYGYVQELRYADVVSRRYTGLLKIERQSGREAADLYANFMQQMEDNDGEYEYFGAGKGTFKGQRERGTMRNGRYVLKEDNHSGVRESHGHESIILEALGKYRPQGELLPNNVIMEIYAGNWLRDHSQIVVPAVLNRKIDIRFNGKVTAVYPNRDFLARILAVLAYDHFFDDYFAHELLEKRNNLRVHLGRLQPMADWLKAEVLAAQRFDNLPKDKQRRYKAIALMVYNNNAAMPLQLFSDLWLIEPQKGKHIVGVYRPQEHIDNPQMEKDERRPEGDSRYADYNDFNKAPNQKSHRTNQELASPHYNLKNYIADSTPENSGDSAFPTALEYVLEQLDISMSGNMHSRHALRALGNAFHVLEDFFAHTNFTEVALIKQGYQVDDHVQQPYVDYREIPIVSGTFGLWDTLASIGPKLGDLVDPLKSMEEYKGFMYGERRLEDFIITAIVEWINIAEISRIWNTYLSLRDQLAGLNEALYVDKAREIAQFVRTARTLASVIKPIISFMLKFAGSGILQHSHGAIRLVQGWGNYGENPTHTQLGKDDHHNALHMLAAKLAIKAVEDVGRRWIACRESPTAANKQAVKDTVKRYFVHPARTNWMDGDIRQWARANPQAIRAAR
ncbi:HET-C-related protein [Acinetobacter sp. NIPH 2699]|uniref:HET-C-related protein n=1 Tax=Acinetobacter sp. NIPH 2699 TaxID=2923433 RepID=UPI001F4BBCF2|nr:HET-C-related protein [Acinetobacter sp. NIPH 2699]MCH7336527.1 LysM peptidoglycan-binding domain-containing protein [Acinetobacter sp. NIPH 2699]